MGNEISVPWFCRHTTGNDSFREILGSGGLCISMIWRRKCQLPLKTRSLGWFQGRGCTTMDERWANPHNTHQEMKSEVLSRKYKPGLILCNILIKMNVGYTSGLTIKAIYKSVNKKTSQNYRVSASFVVFQMFPRLV